LLSFGVFALFSLDYSILHRLLIKAFILCIFIRFRPSRKGFAFIILGGLFIFCIIEIMDPARVAHCAGSEDSLQSTGRSNPQPAADAAAVPPAGGAAQPGVPNNVPVLQGVPVVIGSPEALQEVNNIVSLLETRVNLLTEQSGVVIGSEEEHLAFLHRTAYGVLHDIEPLTHPDVGVLRELHQTLIGDPNHLDSLIIDILQNIG
jgi:hypothetical protein